MPTLEKKIVLKNETIPLYEKRKKIHTESKIALLPN